MQELYNIPFFSSPEIRDGKFQQSTIREIKIKERERPKGKPTGKILRRRGRTLQEGDRLRREREREKRREGR